jgi:hypothetical protein
VVIFLEVVRKTTEKNSGKRAGLGADILIRNFTLMKQELLTLDREGWLHEHC